MKVTGGVMTTVQIDGSMILTLDEFEIWCNPTECCIGERLGGGVPLASVPTEITVVKAPRLMLAHDPLTGCNQ
jgi:hypothetical protein